MEISFMVFRQVVCESQGLVLSRGWTSDPRLGSLDIEVLATIPRPVPSTIPSSPLRAPTAAPSTSPLPLPDAHGNVTVLWLNGSRTPQAFQATGYGIVPM